MDPRGVGQSEPAIDCKANQETEGIYSQPFTTPDNVKPQALIAKDLRYIARCGELNRTDPAARVDGERRPRHRPAAPGARRGARSRTSATRTGRSWASTYASLFPRNYSAHGARRAGRRRPTTSTIRMSDLSAQSGGFERALGRFFQACARDEANVPGLRRRRPVGRVRSAGRAGPTRRRCPPGAATRARSTATTCIFGVIGRRSTPSSNWPDIAKALAAAQDQQRRHDAARVSSTASTAARRRLV